MEDPLWNEVFQARLFPGALQQKEEVQNMDTLFKMETDSICPGLELPVQIPTKAIPIPDALAWRPYEYKQDCKSSFPPSALRSSPGLAGSPSSFFIPVPGTTASSAPSSSSSPSFGFGCIYSASLAGSPTSCPLQSLSLGNSSSTSSDNSSTSSSRQRNLKRKLEVRIDEQHDWTDLESPTLSPGPLTPESKPMVSLHRRGELSRGAQEPRFEPQSPHMISQYSWINEEASVKVSIPFPGIHTFPPSCVSVSFGTESLDVMICDPVKGTQHKLAIKQLYGEVVPRDCEYFQQTDKLVIKLIKVPGRMDAYNKGRPLEWFALKFN